MSRDNSDLYSGMTSASSERLPTPREEQREQKEKDRQKLKPAADVVLELIGKERSNVTDIRSLVIKPETTADEARIELRARELYLGYLNSLEVKVKGIMTVRPTRKRKEGDDE